MSLTPEQFDTLRRPLNGTRVAKRSQGGKQLSYLESWDVRAHLIRMFGYANFDIETLDQYHVATREYEQPARNDDDPPKQMVEAIWFAKIRLTVRDPEGTRLCRYTESAIGSTSGPASMLGEHHDNAVKTAASDALKRCAINLGTQFGLSLYDDGTTRDVVKNTLVKPPGWEPPPTTEEQVKQLEHALGAQVIEHTEKVEVMTLLHGCGRLDDHEPHDWWSRWYQYGRTGRQRFWCKGHVVTEGSGHRDDHRADR